MQKSLAVPSQSNLIKVRKRPLQQRSKEKVARILDASKTILIEEGYANFTTNKVADQSGVNVGSIYQYFTNKEAIIVELYQLWLADAFAAFTEFAEANNGEKDRVIYYVGLLKTYFDNTSDDQYKLDTELTLAFYSNKKLKELDRADQDRFVNRLRESLVQFESSDNRDEDPLWIPYVFEMVNELLQLVSRTSKDKRKAYIKFSLHSLEAILKSKLK